MNERAIIQSLADHVQAALEADMRAGRVPANVRSWRQVPENQEYGLDHDAWRTATDGDTFQRRQQAAFEIVAHRLGWNRAPACACQALLVPDAAPKATGRVRIDKAALRLALGGQAEILEAMEAKASGMPGVNAATMWKYFTQSIYTSGDLPVLATRECLQNSRDACEAAVRARKLRAGDGRLDVTWDASTRALSWKDNGIGMDAATILGKFLVIGETGKGSAGDSEEAAGGFGVAKAVILGCSPSFRWRLHSRDNLAISEGVGQEVKVYDAEWLQGTELIVYDVSPDFDQVWDHARQVYVGIEDRLRELLAANDLPRMALTFNGQEVKPMFSRRGGGKVRVDGEWGKQTTATVKAYRRPPGDRQGSYFVRLGGLFQFATPSQRGRLKADVVVDLVSKIRPGDKGYPLNAARDALQGPARWTFSDLVDEVEKESESVGRHEDDEIYDPDSDQAAEREGAAELAQLTADAFADEAFQKALAEAAGGIADFYAEQAKYQDKQEPVASMAPAGSRARPDDDGPERGMVLPPGMTVAVVAAPVEPDVAASSTPTLAARQLRVVLQAADQAAEQGGFPRSLTAEVAQALDRAELGWPMTEADLGTLAAAVEQAAEASMEQGGGGLIQAAGVARAFEQLQQPALAQPRPDLSPAPAPRKVNPFGKLAGLRISRKRYDRARAYRFKKGYARWIPHLAAWDATLRLVAVEARIRRRFRPGFVLDDELVGLTATTPNGGIVIYVHPDRFAQVEKAHKERPLAIAAFLHGLAVHELTHADGRMGEGHGESYIAAREDLGAATAHLLPAIAVLVTRLLGLPVKPAEDEKRAAKLARDLERSRGTVKELRARVATLEKAGAGTTTPGTRVHFATLGEWLEGWRAITGRRISAARHAAEAAHLEALPDYLVEAGSAEELDALEAIVERERPPRGQRQGHATTRLTDALDRARQRRQSPAERVVDAAVAAMRARPPSGVDATYLDAFLTRHRANLVGLVQARMEAA